MLSMHLHRSRASPLFAALLLLFFLVVHVQSHDVEKHPHHDLHAKHARGLVDSTYEGFRLYDYNSVKKLSLPESCKDALQQPVNCHRHVHSWVSPGYRRSLFNTKLTDYVCDATCGRSLQKHYDQVNSACGGHDIFGALPTLLAGRLWAGFNETCLRSEEGKDYCNDAISKLDHADDYEKMLKPALCSFCHVERMAMMQRSPFSIFNEGYKRRLEYIYEQCALSGPTDIPDSPCPPPPPKPKPFCVSDNTFECKQTETCDSIAKKHGISSADLYTTNQPTLGNCSSIPAGTTLCLPPSCDETYVLQPEDTGRSVEVKFYDPTRGIPFGSLLRTYNPWISRGFGNLRNGTAVYGNVLCLSPPNGIHNKGIASLNDDPIVFSPRTGLTHAFTSPPDDCDVAQDTTLECGKWHKVHEGDSCVKLAISNKITSKLLLAANPSLGTSARKCEDKLTVGVAYCVQPRFGWEDLDLDEDEFPSDD